MSNITQALHPKELEKILEYLVEYFEFYQDDNEIYKELPSIQRDINLAFQEELNGLVVDEETIRTWISVYQQEKKKKQIAVHERDRKIQEEKELFQIGEKFRRDFPRLRAEGHSMKEIADALGIDSVQFVKLFHRMEDAVLTSVELREVEIEAFQKELGLTTENRLKTLTLVLQSILTEIEKRGLESVPTNELLDYALKYSAVLKAEQERLSFLQKKPLSD